MGDEEKDGGMSHEAIQEVLAKINGQNVSDTDLDADEALKLAFDALAQQIKIIDRSLFDVGISDNTREGICISYANSILNSLKEIGGISSATES